jgi:gluconolactonase
MVEMQLEQVRVLTEGLAFPEGPVAMPDGSVVVAEMMSGNLTRVSGDGEAAVLAHVGGGPNGAALGPDGALYVCNNGGVFPDKKSIPSVQRVDPETGATDVLYTECDGDQLVAPNDLVFDSTGGFWFTDFRGSRIHYARPDGSLIRRIDAPASEPNGIGLSPGEDVLYWAQTTSRQVHRRRVTGPGEIVASQGYGPSAAMLADAPDRWSLLVGLPGAAELDSLAIEANGTLCVGTIVEGGVTVIDPGDGSYQSYTLPPELADPFVTNICFGGPDLRTAYLTCSKAGRLVSCQWPRPGLLLNFQQLPGDST